MNKKKKKMYNYNGSKIWRKVMNTFPETLSKVDGRDLNI